MVGIQKEKSDFCYFFATFNRIFNYAGIIFNYVGITSYTLFFYRYYLFIKSIYRIM